jgi:nitrate reductase NapE component
VSTHEPEATGTPDPLRSTERWFIRRGLPMFVEDYSAGRDVWTRALPALATLFVLALLGISIRADDTLGTIISVSVVVGFAIGYVVWNRRRGARPWALPDHVTPTWLAVFVLVPASLTFAFDRSVEGLMQAVVGPVVLLAIVYVVSRYALVALTGWALRWTFGQLGDVVQLVTRVLPLMLLVVTFLYLSPGVWQAMGSSTGWTVAAALLVLAIVGVLFILTRATRELAKVDQVTDRAGVLTATAGTPLDRAVEDLPDLDLVVPMATRQRANMLLVMVVAQLVQVSLIGFVVWMFFVIFGFAAIRLPVQTLWLAGLSDPGIIGPVVDGHAVTHASMRVAAFLGGFAAFYATVYSATDRLYRKHFAERITLDLERALAVRRAYLSARRVRGLTAPVPVEPEAEGL